MKTEIQETLSRKEYKRNYKEVGKLIAISKSECADRVYGVLLFTMEDVFIYNNMDFFLHHN